MKILLVGIRNIQHLQAIRLQSEGHEVEVYPGQAIGAYRCVNSKEVLKGSYDLIIAGSARYFEDPAIISLRDKGTLFFGATNEIGMLESSKRYFKEFALTYGILTPQACYFDSLDEAIVYSSKQSKNLYLKVNGPAGGCGAVSISYPPSTSDLLSAPIRNLISSDKNTYLVEEAITGYEIGINVFVDDSSYFTFPATKPHKRRHDRNCGENVAGMGSISPLLLPSNFDWDFHNLVMSPLMRGFRDNGWSYQGCLFFNIMISDSRLWVLECNCRMGDPAMLVNLLQLQSSFGELLQATARNQLHTIVPLIGTGTATAVTLVDPGYPMSIKCQTTISSNRELWISEGSEHGIVIGGASITSAGLLTITNGVVGSAVSYADSHNDAIEKAYKLAQPFKEVLDSRSDIGKDQHLDGCHSLQST
jgi:phosphoribosylamine---glycine ligase